MSMSLSFTASDVVTLVVAVVAALIVLLIVWFWEKIVCWYRQFRKDRLHKIEKEKARVRLEAEKEQARIRLEADKEQAHEAAYLENLKIDQAKFKKQKSEIKSQIKKLKVPFAPSGTHGHYYCIHCFLLKNLGLNDSITVRPSKTKSGYVTLKCKCGANCEQPIDVLLKVKQPSPA